MGVGRLRAHVGDEDQENIKRPPEFGFQGFNLHFILKIKSVF